VSAITHQAMNGEFDFSESLRRRVKLLAGLDARHLHDLADKLPLTDGAANLVKVLKGLGYKVGIISGGFTVAADRLKDILGLDFAYANKLDIADGKLSGTVTEPIVDAEKKADLLEWVAHKERIPLEQTIAIGDGANDALMLAQAGLGIAFHAKATLKKSADTSVSTGGLEKILYLLGMNARDVEDFLRRP
jgi:phosphoserine phosphatase